MKDKLVVITGGNSGIGSALADIFSEAGAKVLIVDKTSSHTAPGIQYVLDLTHKEDVDQLIENILTTQGTPDVLIFNAGRGIHQKLEEGDPEAWENIFSLNVFSSLRMIRGLLPYMKEKGRGDVVFISSISACKPYPYGGIYCASKSALNIIAETLRLEVQPKLRVLNVLPGVVNTGFFDEIIDGSQTVENIGWGAIEPAEIAKTVFFAISQPEDISLNQIIIRPTAQPM